MTSWRPILWLASIALLAVGWIVANTDSVDAQVPALVSLPSNDGGVIFLPPRQFAAVPISCGTDQRGIIVQCSSDTEHNAGGASCRIGSSRVKAFPVAAKNGIELTSGQSMSFDVGSGVLYGVSESTTDAGVAIGVLCVYGGSR